jgi:hypothetical protein
MKQKRVRRGIFAAAALLLIATPARGVILFGTGDPTANTSAPAGALAGSGWQYEGQFSGFLGTVIASNFFVTAKHIGGSVGQTFTFNSVSYTTIAVFPDPASDLQVWQVAGSFPIHAPLFGGDPGTEVNLGLVVFGRGTQRGNPVFVGSDSHLGGWLWGGGDGVQRWGTNVISSVESDSFYGQLLRAEFNSNAGPDEAHLSAGDSGGAVFVFNGATNQWELAGINLAVDGPFSTSSSGANPFDAAMFDTTGLFVQATSTSWVAAPNPSAFYSTEIAAHKGFIESVVMGLTRVVSRQIHGSAGPFDVDLPESGAPAIECRSGGATNAYQLVFTFARNVTVASAIVSAGAGNVASFSASQNVVTVNLTGVANAQTITVTLENVNDRINISDVQATMRVLVGDTTGNGRVNSSDIAQTQSQSGQQLNSVNCRQDVTVSGEINSSDVAFVQSQSGTGFPVGSTSAVASSRSRAISALPFSQSRSRSSAIPSRRTNRSRDPH